MKFPRNVRILRSPFDVAPFAAVFFLLVIFMMLAGLLPTPGLPLQPPTTDPEDNWPGTDKPTVAVAVDANGRFYFTNQIINSKALEAALADAAKRFHPAPTLVIQADKAVTYDQLLNLTLLARHAGITNALLATLPRVVEAPAKP